MKLIPAALAAAIVLAVAACSAEADPQPTSASGVDTESGNTENPPPADVTVETCGADEVGWITAGGKITNHSSKPSTYFIEVEFLDPAGMRYGEGLASSSTVAPGQVVEWEAPGLTDARPGGTCKVISVDRYEA